MVAMVEKEDLAATKKLGKELLESRAYVNNAPLLLATLASSKKDPQVLVEALLSLEAFFVPLVKSGEYSLEAQSSASEALRQRDVGKEEAKIAKAEAIYKEWVWDRYLEFVSTLLRYVGRDDEMPEVQNAALHSLMELVRVEMPGTFNNQLYLKLCSTLICSEAFNGDLLSVVVSDYFKYLDVCYYTYWNVQKIADKNLSNRFTGSETLFSDDEGGSNLNVTRAQSMVRNMYDVLMNLPPQLSPEDSTTDPEVWSFSSASEGRIILSGKEEAKANQYKEKKWQRKRVSKGWISFLRLPLPLDVYKKVLAQLHKRVMPYLSNPILLCDFLTNSYNVGGLISVMALNGLFILITSHGLEYPDFYNKLYALLEPSIFVAKHRARFFELIDTCLKSTHLPSYLAAAFAKKLGRLALSAPPSGALLVIAMIHNLLRRHPSINLLVHRDAASTTAAEAKRGADPFFAFETDTSKCRALESSLWEIETLRNHYCPAVSRFVASLETDLTVRAKTTEVGISDFSSGSYTTIFTEEVSKRLKAVPLAFFQSVPSSLFSEKTEDFIGWTFKDIPSAAPDDKPSDQVLVSKNISVNNAVSREDTVLHKKKRKSKGSSGVRILSAVDKTLPLPKKKKK